MPDVAVRLATGSADCAEKAPVTVKADTVTTEPVATFDSCSRPVYPPDVRDQGIDGTVSLRFLVGIDGKVGDAKVDSSSGNTAVDKAARSALVQCSFTPGTHNGTPVLQWTQVQYVWKASRPVATPRLA